MHSGLSALDSADRAEADARRLIEGLLFEPLVGVDDRSKPVPSIATAWQYDGTRRRWDFTLRPGVQFSDGTEVTPGALADALSAFGATVASGRTVSLRAEPDLMARLADIPIVRRNGEGAMLGTGPFRLEHFLPNDRVVLIASDTHWGGRPYLDRVEIALRRSFRDQATDFELGRTDVIEVPPEDARRAALRQVRTLTTAPMELIALVFADAVDARLREAVALAIDRNAIQNVLLQRQGVVTGALLPAWMTGYGFLFPAQSDSVRARLLAGQAQRPAQPLSLGYDRNDPLARLVAERISVNARDAGIAIRPTPDSGSHPARLLRWTVPSPDPSIALRDAAVLAGRRPPERSDTAEDAWRAESTLIGDARIVPLLHIPRVWGVGSRVENWRVALLGSLRIADVWLREAPRP